VRVREARAADWPAVAELLAQLGRPDVRGTDEEAEARQVFQAYLAREDTAALVAERDGRLVGFLDMEYRARLNFTSPEAWIPDLVVAEDARSEGAGGALIRRAEELARERGCWGMSLESASWRERAHSFYLREGWDDTAHAFSKSLSDLPWPPPPPDEVSGGRPGPE
jgi:GNAT superfamily N-acetyltransferase